MELRNRPTLGLALALFALGSFGLGCGGQDPVSEFAQANAEVQQARSGLEQARELVKTREAEVAQAQQRLVEARGQVRVAERELATREAAVDREAVDTALFRAVQKRLLEDSALESVAITADVANAVVTLSGRVDTSKQRDRAVAVSQQTPGVERVESRIEVPVAASPPETGEQGE